MGEAGGPDRESLARALRGGARENELRVRLVPAFRIRVLTSQGQMNDASSSGGHDFRRVDGDDSATRGAGGSRDG